MTASHSAEPDLPGPGSTIPLGPLVDHHCHGLLLDPLDRVGFESLLNEAAAPSVLGGSFFDSMLGLAIRRWCAPVLGLEPHARPERYLDRRAELGAEASRRLVRAAGIEVFMVDTGPPATALGPLCQPETLAGLGGGAAAEVLRLETLVEDLLADGAAPEGVGARVRSILSERRVQPRRSCGADQDRHVVGCSPAQPWGAGPIVAAKSIAAYRVGLDLPAAKPRDEALAAALSTVGPGSDGRLRIADLTVHGWLAWTAVELGLPLQIHVGYGDADLDLRLADPLRLTGFLRATEARGVPILLLHSYPYQRSAAYLAQVFGHVFVDVGLAVHNTGALSRQVIGEVLELVPFGKLLFSSDAYGLAELFHLGALLFRRGLGGALAELVAAEEMSGDDAVRVAGLVARDNARRVYGLPPDPSGDLTSL